MPGVPAPRPMARDRDPEPVRCTDEIVDKQSTNWLTVVERIDALYAEPPGDDRVSGGLNIVGREDARVVALSGGVENAGLIRLSRAHSPRKAYVRRRGAHDGNRAARGAVEDGDLEHRA